MLKYQQSLCKSGLLVHTELNTTSAPSTQSTSTSAIAARSQALGCARLRGLNVGVRRSTSFSSLPATSGSGPELVVQSESTPHQELEPTVQEMEEQEACDLADDKRAVDRELGRYEEDGVGTSTMPSERMTDLVREWEVSFYYVLESIVLSYYYF